jgi:hypothetical protein
MLRVYDEFNRMNTEMWWSYESITISSSSAMLVLNWIYQVKQTFHKIMQTLPQINVSQVNLASTLPRELVNKSNAHTKEMTETSHYNYQHIVRTLHENVTAKSCQQLFKSYTREGTLGLRLLCTILTNLLRIYDHRTKSKFA